MMTKSNLIPESDDFITQSASRILAKESDPERLISIRARLRLRQQQRLLVNNKKPGPVPEIIINLLTKTQRDNS